MSFLNKLRDFIFFPIKIWNIIVSILNRFITKTKDFLHHFRILREANISLGKLHLQNGNIKDAKLRFNIIDKIISHNDPENLYWYSWSCVMLSQYSDSLSVLKNTSYNDDIIRNYISNMSTVVSIPDKIINDYNFITSNYFSDRYFSEEENLFQKATSSLIPYLPSQDSNITFNALEISSHPYWLDDLLPFFPKKTNIDTIIFDDVIFEQAKIYNSHTKIYDEISKSERYSLNSKKKYNLILAFDSISTTTKLEEIFKSTKKLLDSDGTFILVIPKNNVVKLEPSMNHFKFPQKFLEDNLKLADFMLTSITSVTLSKKLEYFIIIAK